MLIYAIPNAEQSNDNYVCDSQATIDARPKDSKTNQYDIPAYLCSIGDESQANAILSNNQQAWLTKQAILFTVNLQITVEGGVKWIVVDLSTQPPNIDSQYFVLNPTTGTYTEAIGLDAAKTLFAQTQQIYLAFTNMNQYTTMTSWK
jgi:hypothetical protein